jgi:hypothetical protein
MEQQQEYQSQQQMADMQQQLADLQAQEAYAAVQPSQAPSAPAPGADLMQQLQTLSSMKAQGLLSDEEFAAAKAKLLGS